MDLVRERLLVHVREGMKQAMHGLAENVGGKLQGDPIHSHSGDLLAAVLKSPRVWENGRSIGGTVSANVGEKNVGLWLEEGHEFPGRRRRQFDSRNLRRNPALAAAALARRLSGEDRVRAYPFLGPSLEEYAPTITQIIQEKVADAVVE
jgi:hypothetical protein